MAVRPGARGPEEGSVALAIKQTHLLNLHANCHEASTVARRDNAVPAAGRRQATAEHHLDFSVHE